jgi:hypothetical protein
MFAELLMLAVLGCPVTKLENRSQQAWNVQDFIAMIDSMEHHRCAYHFKYKPCLEKFYKLRPRNYFAGCGSQVK